MPQQTRRNQAGRRLTGQPAASPGIAWIPAVIGLAVSAYLLGFDLLGGRAVCLTSSSCDAVRSSLYARLLGIPVSAVGVVFFAGALALWRARSPRCDRSLEVLAAAGAGAALVFVALQLAVIRALCPYCLVAEAAAFALAYLVLKSAPPAGQARAWAAVGAAVIILATIYAVTPAAPPGSAYAAGLARHLAQSGAVFYGAYWCPHCRDQKALFGSAAALLPYVECDPRGTHAQAALCQARGINAYPTWEFHGQLVEGVLTLDNLARRSGYPPPPGR